MPIKKKTQKTHNFQACGIGFSTFDVNCTWWFIILYNMHSLAFSHLFWRDGQHFINTSDLVISFFQRSPLFAGLRLWLFSFSISYHIFLVDLPAYFRNHSPLLREHIFVGFNKFPSVVCWCTVIHHHWPHGLTLLRRVRWDFKCVQCNMCTDTGPLGDTNIFVKILKCPKSEKINLIEMQTVVKISESDL